jgi:manganese/zinc/iron transport system permease protein
MEAAIGSDALWIVLSGCLVAVSAGVLGCYLLLRRSAMMGDAISHAVLPGIVAAYFFSGSLQALPALLGAAAVGLLCTLLISALEQRASVQSDAATGLVYTFLFAVGVIMVSGTGGHVDLDADCILFGELAFLPFGERLEGVPMQTLLLGGNLLLVLAAVAFGFRGLFLTTFDPLFARALGISTGFWQNLLMALTALTAVVAFESVGAILVVGFLVVPAATAHLLTDRLPVMMALAALAGVTASVGGYALALSLDANIAGAMMVVLGAEFALAFAYQALAKRGGASAHPMRPEPGPLTTSEPGAGGPPSR